MNKEEIREYIVAKRTPISHCVDLTRYFIGRHKTLPIFLTPAFEMEFNRSMQELEILREQLKKQKEVIDKLEKYIEKETRIYGLSMSIELRTHFDNILGILKYV